MSELSEYQRKLLKVLQTADLDISLMEVCGTHTMAIAKSGIRQLLPKNVRLLSGPGCPVCVTSQSDIDAVIELSQRQNLIMVTFGDMIRVPGTRGSLQEARSEGADIRIAYSPLDALRIAGENPRQEVVFLGIGFETTAPAIAATLEQAGEMGLRNFSVFSLHKLVPPALENIFSDPAVKVDGLICPGHVSIVIGTEPYAQLAEKYNKPCVITGFETLDILEGIYRLILQIKNTQAQVEIQYRRVVKAEGNKAAQEIIKQIFEPSAARWRGLGIIPDSGLVLRQEYAHMDARLKFDIAEREEIPIKGCACGEVLTGRIIPPECALFGKVCTPLKPVGPCMVSQEGSCAAYFRYIQVKGASL